MMSFSALINLFFGGDLLLSLVLGQGRGVYSASTRMVLISVHASAKAIVCHLNMPELSMHYFLRN